jgi:hypothetical protein
MGQSSWGKVAARTPKSLRCDLCNTGVGGELAWGSCSSCLNEWAGMVCANGVTPFVGDKSAWNGRILRACCPNRKTGKRRHWASNAVS